MKKSTLKDIPRFHDFISAGISQEQAAIWHDAIMTLENHAKNMADNIEALPEGQDFKAAANSAKWFAHSYHSIAK